jgi:hypothetical protein
MPNREEWLDYARSQGQYGVPALYYLERVGEGDEPIDVEHLAEVGRLWDRYRETLR